MEPPRNLTDAERAVLAGITWLDRNGPSDWRERIKRPVDIGVTLDCVVGQVYAPEAATSGVWSTGWGYFRFDVISDDLNLAMRLGFTADPAGGGPRFGDLTHAWRRALGQESTPGAHEQHVMLDDGDGWAQYGEDF